MASILADMGLWAAVSGAALALIILLSLLGRAFGPGLGIGKTPGSRKALFLVMVALCILLALSLVPLMVGAVLGFQEGNRPVPAVAFALDHQEGIVIALWLLMLAGSALAVPAMLREIRFDG